jgi:hypothetical protein
MFVSVDCLNSMTRRAIFPGDVQRLGGHVAVQCVRDRVESTLSYKVEFISRGGDVAWQSSRIADIDRAIACATTLAEFTGARLIEHPPPDMQRAALAGDPNCKSKSIISTSDNATEPVALQERRIARLLLVQPETAATIARLCYGAPQS